MNQVTTRSWAVQTYDFDRGSFLAYAKMQISSRLIDYFRSQSRHGNQVSLELIAEDDGYGGFQVEVVG